MLSEAQNPLISLRDFPNLAQNGFLRNLIVTCQNFSLEEKHILHPEDTEFNSLLDVSMASTKGMKPFFMAGDLICRVY